MMFDLRPVAWRAVRMATVLLWVGSTGCSVFRPLVQERPSAAPANASPRAAQAVTAEAEPAAGKVALGRVNGKVLYSTDLDTGLQQEISRSKSEALQREMHLRWVGFRGLVGESLLDEEARRLGISREELYRREVIERVTPPSENELKRLYDANRARFQGASFEEVE